MSNQSANNKRIAKNTLVLYVRMFIVLFVNLYVSRVILTSLGVVDYGIYNVVGSVVVMFSYMNSALSLATTRFLSYEMRNGVERLNVVFNTSFVIQVVFALIIVLISESIGLWLVNEKLVIPEERLGIANWVYQFSVLTTVVSIVSVPYNSAIISHERMNVFAVVSIIEVLLKLTVALIIVYVNIDRLLFYGFALLLVSILSFIMRLWYCNKFFEEIEHIRVFNKQLFKEMFSFVGWNFFGATAGMSVGQGLNFIINIFFGPAVNAARGIAIQVEGAINQFVTSINTAVNPQIIKRYSNGDRRGTFNLVFFASKISFLLLLSISLPVIVDCNYLLSLWLWEVPEHAVLFTQLILIYLLTLSLTYSINMSAQASGNIKYFQIAEGCIIFMNIPIVLLLFYMGFPAYVSFVSMIVISIVTFIVKVVVLKNTIGFPIKDYIVKVIFRLLLISLICASIYIVAKNYSTETFLFFVCKTLAYIIPLLVAIWAIALDENERRVVRNYAKGFITRTGKEST